MPSNTDFKDEEMMFLVKDKDTNKDKEPLCRHDLRKTCQTALAELR